MSVKTQTIEHLQIRLEALEARHQNLLESFDALADAVIEDLGYNAMTQFSQFFTGQVKLSPRRLSETIPEAPQIIRKPTARCRPAKQGKTSKFSSDIY